MDNEELKNLQSAFEAAYIFPFAKYAWRSQRARHLWVDLEVWQDALAGPVSTIIEDGNCAYVYAREDEFFAGINDPAALQARLQQWHAQLTAKLALFIPENLDENTDLEAIQGFTSGMWSVAEKAIEIEKRRYAALHL
jgi:hypothetical protein